MHLPLSRFCLQYIAIVLQLESNQRSLHINNIKTVLYRSDNMNNLVVSTRILLYGSVLEGMAPGTDHFPSFPNLGSFKLVETLLYESSGD